MSLEVITFGSMNRHLFITLLDILERYSSSVSFSAFFTMATIVGFCILAIKSLDNFAYSTALKWALTLFFAISILWKIPVRVALKETDFCSQQVAVRVSSKQWSVPIGVGFPLSVLTTMSYCFSHAICKHLPQANSESFLSSLFYLMNKPPLALNQTTTKSLENFTNSCLNPDLSCRLYSLDDLYKLPFEKTLTPLSDFFHQKSSIMRHALIHFENGSSEYYPCKDAFKKILNRNKHQSNHNLKDFFSNATTLSQALNSFHHPQALKNIFIVQSLLPTLNKLTRFFENSWIAFLPQMISLSLALGALFFPLIIGCLCLPRGLVMFVRYIKILATLSWTQVSLAIIDRCGCLLANTLLPGPSLSVESFEAALPTIATWAKALGLLAVMSPSLPLIVLGVFSQNASQKTVTTNHHIKQGSQSSNCYERVESRRTGASSFANPESKGSPFPSSSMQHATNLPAATVKPEIRLTGSQQRSENTKRLSQQLKQHSIVYKAPMLNEQNESKGSFILPETVESTSE